MNWFKRIKAYFNGYDADEFKEYDPTNTTQEDKPTNNTNKIQTKEPFETHREIEAKVIYQYPKGEFRFPLIPDETRERRKPRERENKLADEKPKDSKNLQTRQRRSHSTKENIENQQENHRPLEKKQIKKTEIKLNAGPFKPSEIPSPIYGFGQRKSQIKEETKLEQYERIEPTEYDLGIARGRKESASLEEQYNQLSLYDEPEQVNVRVEEDLIVATNNEPEQVDERMEEAPIVATNNEPEQVDERVEEAPIVATNNEPEQVIASFQVEDELTVSQNQTAVALEKSIPYSNQYEEVEEKRMYEDVAQDEGQTNIHSMEDAHANVEEEIETETSSHQPQKRSHLPFNVMMLQSDRKKLNVNETPEFHPSSQVKKNDFYRDEEIEENLPNYVFPSMRLLDPPVNMDTDEEWLLEQEELLNATLHHFNVRAHVIQVTKGPAVTRFEVQPEPGVKVNKITNLADDIKLSLAARDIRIEAPIPGKHAIGIEVPNQKSRPVQISEIIHSEEFMQSESPLTAVLGLDIAGDPIVTDLRKMPHGLIAGATGSGKSVCINSILISLLYKADPEELKLLLIDPKMVELAPYNQIPHLVSPVITDVKAATASLKWAVEEMERRYELFAHSGVRDINRYNDYAEANKQYHQKLPYIVIVIDELADLMMMSPADVEEAICRIAQKARACGIHLIIATQRPSVDVITGLIKANVPTRIAFSVSSQVDSRTIIDISGAEKLLGRGDMLFLENGSSKPVRLQGTFVSDQEIDDVVAHVRKEQKPQYLFEQDELLKKAKVTEETDELFFEACYFVIDHQAASASMLQRRFKIGYNRAARLIDMMEEQDFVSENRGSKPRDVLITEMELNEIEQNSE
ncbi:DNA translocase FtsK [Cytobacillus sp. OWB-43]|uniref:DNA translocase FtsK n=1 Tax=Cytobacillus sp. OWB-43 TaxID=3108468 RepID=UPI002AFFB9BA|nr:DNA translocase FtsK [Cytobacillus sp. OWB-43]MEA1855111.1 DNA translocase FtsK [Cytobacillus sp. OWB-43]